MVEGLSHISKAYPIAKTRVEESVGHVQFGTGFWLVVGSERRPEGEETEPLPGETMAPKCCKIDDRIGSSQKNIRSRQQKQRDLQQKITRIRQQKKTCFQQKNSKVKAAEVEAKRLVAKGYQIQAVEAERLVAHADRLVAKNSSVMRQNPRDWQH